MAHDKHQPSLCASPTGAGASAVDSLSCQSYSLGAATAPATVPASAGCCFARRAPSCKQMLPSNEVYQLWPFAAAISALGCRLLCPPHSVTGQMAMASPRAALHRVAAFVLSGLPGHVVCLPCSVHSLAAITPPERASLACCSVATSHCPAHPAQRSAWQPSGPRGPPYSAPSSPGARWAA